MRNQHTGFALLSLEDRRRVAALGGATSHALGKAHCWTKAEAQVAGRQGGLLRAARARQARADAQAAAEARLAPPNALDGHTDDSPL